jgi:hypothetical protein
MASSVDLEIDAVRVDHRDLTQSKGTFIHMQLRELMLQVLCNTRPASVFLDKGGFVLLRQ